MKLDIIYLVAIVFIVVIAGIFFVVFIELPTAVNEWNEQEYNYTRQLNYSMTGSERLVLAEKICKEVSNNYSERYWFPFLMNTDIKKCALNLVR